MKNVVLMCAGVAVALYGAGAVAQSSYKVPRLADGTPDFQGVWTNQSATPMERSPALGTRRTFTAEEIALASNHSFMPVTLGENRLRTETAGVVAVALMRG